MTGLDMIEAIREKLPRAEAEFEYNDGMFLKMPENCTFGERCAWQEGFATAKRFYKRVVEAVLEKFEELESCGDIRKNQDGVLEIRRKMAKEDNDAS